MLMAFIAMAKYIRKTNNNYLNKNTRLGIGNDWQLLQGLFDRIFKSF